MSTKYIVKNIFVVFLSLLDSQLSNSIDLKIESTFLLSVVQTMKKFLQTARDSSHAKQPD